MIKVYVDTNFFLIPYQFKVDIFAEIDRIITSEYQLCTVKECVDELKHLMEHEKGADKRAAKLAFDLLMSKKFYIVPRAKQKAFKGADNHLFKIAETGKDYVATNDKGLKARLRAKDVNLIVLRQKNHLIIE